MAYMTQEHKKSVAPKIKKLLKKYNLKGSVSVRHGSILVLKIPRGGIDFEVGEEGYRSISNRNSLGGYNGDAKKALGELIDVMMEGNHNNSDPYTDYFDVGWYIDIEIGQWNKPYEYISV